MYSKGRCSTAEPLPAPIEHTNVQPRQPLVAPPGTDNANERALIEIWQDILGSNGITSETNFFEAGGHSLLAVRMLARRTKA